MDVAALSPPLIGVPDKVAENDRPLKSKFGTYSMRGGIGCTGADWTDKVAGG